METIEKAIGRHLVRIVPPSTVVVRYSGDVTRDEGRAISELIAERGIGDPGRIRVVANLTHLGNIPADARKEMAMQRGTESDGLAEVFLVNATLRTKVLMTVVLAAIKITGKGRMVVKYFDSEDAALAWTSE